jgi:hypothetical protein
LTLAYSLHRMRAGKGTPPELRSMRFLLVLLACVWVLMLLRSILKMALHFLFSQARANAASTSGQKPDGDVRRLVRDPECGIYVREDRALPLNSGAGILHFCSPACRDRYFARQQKLAASA